VIEVRTEFRKPEVGMESCVGVGGNFPLDFGNYFWLDDGLRIINMWSENLREFIKRNPEIKEIECKIYKRDNFELGIVIDNRVPKSWLTSRLCVTGCGWGSRELLEYISADLGFSVENKLCGCELPEQRPVISRGFSFGSKITSYRCSRCKRSWEN
jgi:hypothetical protein